MKLLLAIAFILLTEVAFSQTITDTTLIKGRLNDTYYMYDRPANPEGKRLRLLKKGEFVYIAGMVTTNLTPPQDVWYHCVSRNTDGFIPTDLIELYGDWSTEKFVYLKENKNLPFPGRIKLSKLASSQDGQIEDSIQKNEIEKLVSLRKQLDSSEKVMIKNIGIRAKVDKLLIVSYSYPTNILGYPDFHVRFINGCDKSIKYVTFKIVAYNPVNDLVGTKEVKCIGEIPSFENKEYHFEDVFISKVTDHFTIPTVKIQFMDNSIISIPGDPLFSDLLISEMKSISQLDDFEKILREVYYSHIK